MLRGWFLEGGDHIHIYIHIDIYKPRMYIIPTVSNRRDVLISY